MTTRQEKVNSLLQREIAAYLNRERPEGITGLVTITAVEVTADLEHAKVFFSVVGQPEEEVLEILKKHIYEIQGVLYEELTMRKVPRVAFAIDTSGKYAGHISKILKDIKDINDSDK